ncbi:MAG: hypothetical protein HXY38_10165 [Chloroflexi bacterium]|nr:hypothetical protein [Chloroflexota bacterium]
MLRLFLILSLLFQDAPLAITAPQPGETLHELVEIQGRMDLPHFASAELAFTFDQSVSDPAAGWFVIQTFSQPPTDSVLSVWDTTALTDGVYALRLRVFLLDGNVQEVLISNLTIRNNEQLSTPAFRPTDPVFNFQPLNETPGDSSQPTPAQITMYPTSTPLPPNLAALTASSIINIFWKSAVTVLALFAFVSFILRLRKNI